MTCLWCFLYLTTVDRTIDRSFALLSFTNNNNSREDVRWIDRSHLTRIAHRWTEFNGNRRLLGQHQSMIIIISDRKSLHVIIGRNKRGAQMVIIYDCVLNVSETERATTEWKTAIMSWFYWVTLGRNRSSTLSSIDDCKGYNLDCGNSICYTQCYFVEYQHLCRTNLFWFHFLHYYFYISGSFAHALTGWWMDLSPIKYHHQLGTC